MASGLNISNIEQQFYRYELWEDFQSGMYNPPEDDRTQKAIELLSDSSACREYMKRVVTEWDISAQQVLTNPEMNGKAWLGQCACFLYAGVHDEDTRKAWCLLKPSVQKKANGIARDVINEWLIEFAKRFPNYQASLFDMELL